MFSQPGSEGDYAGLQKRLARKMEAAKIRAQITEALERSFEAALAEERLVVSRPERKRLFKQITQSILEKILAVLDDR